MRTYENELVAIAGAGAIPVNILAYTKSAVQAFLKKAIYLDSTTALGAEVTPLETK